MSVGNKVLINNTEQYLAGLFVLSSKKEKNNSKTAVNIIENVKRYTTVCGRSNPSRGYVRTKISKQKKIRVFGRKSANTVEVERHNRIVETLEVRQENRLV